MEQWWTGGIDSVVFISAANRSWLNGAYRLEQWKKLLLAADKQDLYLQVNIFLNGIRSICSKQDREKLET